MRRLFRKEPKSEIEIREEIDNQVQANRAYRLSLEMRDLANDLVTKANQLEEELADGRKA